MTGNAVIGIGALFHAAGPFPVCYNEKDVVEIA